MNPFPWGMWRGFSGRPTVVRRLCRTRSELDDLCRHVDDSMVAFGATAGSSSSIPGARRRTGESSLHFHILCYGRIDTTSFRKANPGWLIKRVHARGRIGHTAAYLMTHMGLGMAKREYDDLVMANPFEEPDEYILRRQRVAFGTETEVLM